MHWEHGVLATGPLGKSLVLYFELGECRSESQNSHLEPQLHNFQLLNNGLYLAICKMREMDKISLKSILAINFYDSLACVLLASRRLSR